MKPSFTASWLLAALIAVPTLALAHDPKAPASAAPVADVSDQAKPAVAVVEQFSSALRTGDLEHAGALLADDILILESGGAERSRAEYLGGHAIHDAAFLKAAHVQVKHRTARVNGGTAWVGTESELHTSKDGKALTLLSTETMVLKKTAAGWRITHIHWSSRPKKGDKSASEAASPVSQQPTAATSKPPIWMPADDRAVLKNAQGAGMAKAAEAHGWPGPRHVLDMADDLQLDAQQRERMQELMAKMQAPHVTSENR